MHSCNLSDSHRNPTNSHFCAGQDWNLDLMKKIAPPEQLSIAKG